MIKKIYRNINYVHDCKLLQSNIDSVQNWCLENGLILNVSKSIIISFSRKCIGIIFTY
jgi:hypothetical protein